MNDQTETIQALIHQRRSISLVDRHQETTLEIWERHRRYYFEALNNGTISLLMSVATIAGKIEVTGAVWKGQYKNKDLAIRVNQEPHLEVTLGKDTICSNKTPGQEFLIPDDWILVARDALSKFEADRDERARQAEINRIHEQAQKELSDHVEAVQIFSVLEA